MDRPKAGAAGAVSAATLFCVVATLFLAAGPLQSDSRAPQRSRTGVPRERAPQPAGPRVSEGLVAYYPLLLGAGPTAVDRGPDPGRLDLRLSGAASWLPDRNGVTFAASEEAPGAITRRAAPDLCNAIVAANAFSVEVWLKAAVTEQEGPARIITYSSSPWQRNFMLGVEGSDVRVRIRTSETDENGTPDIRFHDAVSTELEHYVVTFSGGTVALYRNGALFGAEQREGDLSSWEPGYSLLLGNEVNGERSWLGELYGAAIYNRALNDAEAAQNFAAGPNPAVRGAGNQPPLVDAGPDRTVIQPTAQVWLAGAALDDGINGQPLDVSWSVLEGPAEVGFENAGVAYASARFSAPGDYLLELRASDGDQTASDQARVRVVATSRVERDLLAFYPFTEGRGEAAEDHSGRSVAPTLELLNGAEWVPGGNGISLTEEGLLHSMTGAAELRHALVSRNAFTFEVWAQPHAITQSDAALLVFSERSYREKNFFLAQDREGLAAGVRTSGADKDDGRPSLRAPDAFRPALGQFVATWDGSMLRLYRNGERIEERSRPGDLSAWNPDLPLVIGAEGDGHHGWAGEVHLAAVYGRALSESELRRNYQVGGREMITGGAPVANEAPVADAGDDRLVSLPNDLVRLRAKADDDGLPSEALAYSWTQTSGPTPAQIEEPNALHPLVRFTQPGDYILELAADDGQFVMRDQVEVAVLPESYARLLDHSTWGPTPQLIRRLREIGPEEFIDEQLAARPSEFREDDIGGLREVQDRFFYHGLYGEDQLRQRMVFALSKILVVSANSVGRRDQMVPYLRILNEHAFGNYLDLLREVALNPTMGEYLDMVNNAAQDEEYPDPPNENWARELLQLFTLGVDLLNPDGTPKLDSSGVPLPAYTEEDVHEFTRAFTGWTYPTPPHSTLHWPNYDYYDGRMEPVEERHDSGEKRLLNGTVLPAGQSARQDLEAALRNLFEHPNLGPFLAFRLIQQFVSSNPSPGYVERVAAVFSNNGEGVRGDLGATIRAVLLDPEAAAASPSGGRLREPVHYSLALLRALGAQATPSNGLNEQGLEMGQWVFYPPSVFSYFSPDYRLASGLLGPEFQIFTKGNALERANFVDEVVRNALGYGVTIDLFALKDLSNEPERLLDALDEMLFQGRMESEVRAAAKQALELSDEPRDRVRNAVYVAATAAEYQVEH